MTSAIKRWVRPVALPCLHCWQWFHDVSLGKIREYREKLRQYRERREILSGATVVMQDIHGMRFVLYPFDRPNLFSLFRRSADVAEFEVISELVRPGNIAVDIGANVGVYAVQLSRLCGPTGHVWAFEPVPDTYWRLRETLALNRCDNVSPIKGAVSDEDGTVRMGLFEPQFAEWNSIGNHLMHTADGTPVSPDQSVEVPALTLDKFCEAKGIERINFMKVDVEGFEYSVFRGAQRLLREHRVDYICFEISKEPLYGAGVESRNVFGELKAHGYAAYRYDTNTSRFQGPIQDTSELWMNFFASWKELSNIEIAAYTRGGRQEPRMAAGSSE
jgi:FkbM family methyltransferase